MQTHHANFQLNDGGRAAAGYLGKTGECGKHCVYGYFVQSN